MVYEFLLEPRDEIIAAARAEVAGRMSPRWTDEELNGTEYLPRAKKTHGT